MKLSPGCCRCCAESTAIADLWARDRKLARQQRRRPVFGCSCRFWPAADRCRCDWCQQVLAWWDRCERPDCPEPVAFGPICQQHREQDRQRDRAKAARQRAVRTPPRPPWEHQAGCCSLCGLNPLPPRRRSWCSDECVNLWAIATSSDSAYAHLAATVGACCWECGTTTQMGVIDPADLLGYVFPHGAARWTLADLEDRRPWRGPWCDWPPPPHGPPSPVPVQLFVDHVRPLWSLTTAERGELRWWLPFNLQLLCKGCHDRKTSREAGDRARIRRELAA